MPPHAGLHWRWHQGSEPLPVGCVQCRQLQQQPPTLLKLTAAAAVPDKPHPAAMACHIAHTQPSPAQPPVLSTWRQGPLGPDPACPCINPPMVGVHPPEYWTSLMWCSRISHVQQSRSLSPGFMAAAGSWRWQQQTPVVYLHGPSGQHLQYTGPWPWERAAQSLRSPCHWGKRTHW